MITDEQFASIVSVWESLQQFFIVNGCHAEGFAYELQRAGRIIYESVGVTEESAIDHDLTEFLADVRLFSHSGS